MNNKGSTALFIRNRNCYGVKPESIKSAILYVIHSGIIIFLSGGLGYFDEIGAKIVYQLKENYPNVKNILVIPYKNFIIFDRSVFDEIVYQLLHLRISTDRRGVPLQEWLTAYQQ